VQGPQKLSEESLVDVKNTEIRVDEVMKRVQETARNRWELHGAPHTAPRAEVLQAPGWDQIDEQVARAQKVALVGAYLPSMTRLRGLKRLVAVVGAKFFLRAAQLITRDQREFNLAILEILRPLHKALASQAEEVSTMRLEVAKLLAEVTAMRAEISEARAAELLADNAQGEAEPDVTRHLSK
jgi:hypothetical protein